MSQSNTRDVGNQAVDKEKEFLQLKSVIAEFSERFKHDITVRIVRSEEIGSQIESTSDGGSTIEFVIKGGSKPPYVWTPTGTEYMPIDADYKVLVHKGGIQRKYGLKAQAIAAGHFYAAELKELYSGLNRPEGTGDILILGPSNNIPKLASLRFFFSPNKFHEVARTVVEEAAEIMSLKLSILEEMGKVGKFVKILASMKNIIGELNPAAKAALSVVELVEKNLEKQDKMHHTIKDLVDSMVSMVSFTDLLDDDKSKIKIRLSWRTLQKMLEVIEDTSQFVVDYCKTPLRELLLGESKFEKKVAEFKKRFVQLKEDYGHCIGNEVWHTVLRLENDIWLAKLNPSPGARYSILNACLEGTRVGLLEEISTWAASGREQVMWIYGPAGSGKSSLVTSAAELLKGSLGGYFFSRRDDPNLRNPGRVLPTVVSRLAVTIPVYGNLVVEELRSQPDLGSQDILQQFQSLLKGPLEKMKEQGLPIPETLLVIDALDELGLGEDDFFTQAEKRKNLIVCLCSLHSIAPWLKIIITSRPTQEIVHALESCSTPRIEINIHEAKETNLDIEKYLTKSFKEMAQVRKWEDWPSDKQIQDLVHIASGLFIWAATTFKYVARAPDAKAHLDRIINDEYKEDGTLQLQSLYKTIVKVHEEENIQKDYDKVLSLVAITSKHSLIPIQVYDRILKMTPGSASSALRDLMSVLFEEPNEGVVSAYHKSFLDFLDTNSYSEILKIDMSQINNTVSLWCLEQMSECLRFNICNLSSSYLPNYKVEGLSQKIKTTIMLPLKFSCLHWFEFITQEVIPSQEHILNLKEIFMSPKVLYYLEALSILSCIERAVLAIEKLESIPSIGDHNDTLRMMLKELKQFIKQTSPCFQYSSPHLYISALTWVPSHAKMFREFILPHFTHLPTLWDPHAHRDHEGQLTTLNAFSPVMAVAYSPDGRYIVSGCFNNTIRIWDANTGAAHGKPLVGHKGAILSVDYSPDGKYIVSGSYDNTIRVWNARTGAPHGEPFIGHSDAVRSVGYSPDGEYIASGSSDSTVRVWDVKTGEPHGEPLIAETSNFTVAYSLDGEYMIKGSYDKNVRESEAPPNAPFEGPLTGHTNWVLSVAYSPDGKYIVSGYSDNTVRVWNTQTGTPHGEPLTGHTDWVLSAVYSPDGKFIVSGSEDATLRVWNAQTGAPHGEPLIGHTEDVDTVVYSPDGKYIASASNDKTLRVWDAQTGLPHGKPFTGHTDKIKAVTYSHDGQYIVSGSFDKTIKIWDVELSAHHEEPTLEYVDLVASVAYSSDGRYIVSGSGDNTIRLWDALTGNAHGDPLTGHVDTVVSIAYSPDGMYIVSGSWDKTIRMWDAQTGASFGEPFIGHTERVTSVVYSPDGTYIASGSEDKTLQVWHVQTGVPHGKPFVGHTGRVTSVAYSQDGKYIASGSIDKTIRVWDAQTGVPHGVPLTGHTNWVTSVTFSQDGKYIASGSVDKTVRVWELQIGGPHGKILVEHTSPINSIAYSLDGKHIVSGSDDKTVRVWDAQTGEPWGDALTGHSDIVTSVACSQDRRYIVSGSLDGTLRLWDILNLAEGHSNNYIAGQSGLLPSSKLLKNLSCEEWEDIKKENVQSRVDDDGWIRSNDGSLVLWVAHEFCNGIQDISHLCLPKSAPGHPVFLDLTDSSFGRDWTKVEHDDK